MKYGTAKAIFAGLGTWIVMLGVAKWPEIHAQFDPAAAQELAEKQRALEAAAVAKLEAERRAELAKREKAKQSQRENEALRACWDAVRDNARFPTKVSFDPGIMNVPRVVRIRGDKAAIGVRGTVELMNGMGLMIPHRYSCDVKNGIVIRIAVNPG